VIELTKVFAKVCTVSKKDYLENTSIKKPTQESGNFYLGG